MSLIIPVFRVVDHRRVYPGPELRRGAWFSQGPHDVVTVVIALVIRTSGKEGKV